MGNFFDPNKIQIPWLLRKPDAKGPVRTPPQQPACPAPQAAKPANPFFNTTPSLLLRPEYRRSASFNPSVNPFCKPQPVTGRDSLPQGARPLYDAIMAYPDSKATPQDAVAIAKHTYDASRSLKMDSKVLLAIFAHESNGFDTDARSHTGAGGIGQLTDSAINETRRLSNDPTYDGPGERQSYPRADIRAVLERSDVRGTFQRIDQRRENRNNVHDNIWTSTAYARIMMDRATSRGTASVDGMLRRYNAAGGAEEAAYPGKVADAYRALWHTSIPKTLRNP